MNEIPVTTDSDQICSIVLEDTPIYLRCRWNARQEQWYLDVYDVDMTPMAQGQAMVLGSFILRNLNLGIGAFVLIDGEGDNVEAGLSDLGTRVKLYHMTEAELELLP